MTTNIFTIILFCKVALLFSGCKSQEEPSFVMTVTGPVPSDELGTSLIHEHILVDFIGANEIDPSRWERTEVIKTVIPFLTEVQQWGTTTLFDCTPAYLGRDVLLLQELSEATGMNIVTNTGYYGARNNKFLPPHAFTESADELANRWIEEWKEGIEGTGIKPSLIKIGVDEGSLSDIHRKLITAAARTHLKTGLTIASHTGKAVPAFEQIDILEREGVSPEAFVWVHAQAEEDLNYHVKAAERGAWISLDGVSRDNIKEYLVMIKNLKNENLLNRVLISHDAGWYSPGEENGGTFRGYTTIFELLIPALKKEGFSDQEVNKLLIENPAKAFAVSVRKFRD